MSTLFPRRSSIREIVPGNRLETSIEIESRVREIVGSIREEGETALRKWSNTLDDHPADAEIYLSRAIMEKALGVISTRERTTLEAAADRIRAFAQAQRMCITDLNVEIPGGRAGHRVTPVENAGCYVPGGKYPLPSSVLMTVIPARVAGVASLWVATPKPDPYILAASAVAGADGVLVAGGAQAIAALAFGVGPVPTSDVLVGPGNQYVTEAKRQLAGETRIDMLAGPSELLIIADSSAEPSLVAADLLAQAEHDEQAIPVLVSTDSALVEAVESELYQQLESLPTAKIASASLANGGSLVAESLEDAIQISNEFTPEHLQLSILQPETVSEKLRHYGALFLGEASGEVLGDYGAGPNHVLPTGSAARNTGGLSVFTFLRQQTWMEMDAENPLYDVVANETAAMARIEGLEGHARATEQRLGVVVK